MVGSHLVVAAASLALLVSSTLQGLPTVDTDGTLNVAILIMPGIFISEATAPFDMYKRAPENKTNVYFVAKTMDPVTTYYGARLKPDHTFDDAPNTDILVVPSGIGSHHTFLTSWYSGTTDSDGVVTGKTVNDQDVIYYGNVSELITWVQKAAGEAKIITSHCWGAFTLADAGLLDGKTVTTFPGYTGDLMKYYPAIGAVVDDERFVVDGNIHTSNGAVAAFEACLHVIRHLYGSAHAETIETGLVFSEHNIGHSKLEYFKPSPAAGTATMASGEAKVGILLLEGTYISEPVGPFDVFAHMGGYMTAFFVGETKDPITTYYGATMYPDYSVADAPELDVLVIPSGANSMTTDQDKTAVIQWIKDAAAQATWVTSHCWGAFLLGKAGLLDGKVATTFPGYFQNLRDQFPQIATVVEDKRIVRDGNIVTSHGGIAAYEAPNYVLWKHYDEYWAKKVAIGLVYAEDNYNVMMDAHEVNVDNDANAGTVASPLLPLLLLPLFAIFPAA